MISRRNFLKLSGLAVTAVGSGFSAGRLLNSNSSTEVLRLQAFLPDAEAISKLTAYIGKKLNYPELASVNGNYDLRGLVTGSYTARTEGNGAIKFNISQVEKEFNSDLLISDNSLKIYNPEEDFNGFLMKLRSEIKDRGAKYSFSADYCSQNLLHKLFRSNEKQVVIENEHGIVDKINLKYNYNDVLVSGPLGKTGIKISENSVHIFSSCCKNGLCQLSGKISSPGEILACAPNKILVRIENV